MATNGKDSDLVPFTSDLLSYVGLKRTLEMLL